MGRPTLDKMGMADKDLRIVSLEATLGDLIVIAEIVARNAGGNGGERADLGRASEAARGVLFPIGDAPQKR